jgi:DNA-binding SARP family transcriptional activator
MDAPWRIQLLGGLRAERGERVVTRFRTQKTGLLLAYLAYYRQRAHPREALIELLWPESDLDSARHKLNVALSAIRDQLEPEGRSRRGAGAPSAAILVTDRSSVRLDPASVVTDVAEFEAALGAAAAATHPTEQVELLVRAVDLYRGPLLPGYYEEWVLREQQRWEELFFQAVRQLIECCENGGEQDRALQYALRAVSVDPLREEAHRDLMRLQPPLRPKRPPHPFRSSGHQVITHQPPWSRSVAPSPSTPPSTCSGPPTSSSRQRSRGRTVSCW